jgi:hypothetical protein
VYLPKRGRGLAEEVRWMLAFEESKSSHAEMDGIRNQAEAGQTVYALGLARWLQEVFCQCVAVLGGDGQDEALARTLTDPTLLIAMIGHELRLAGGRSGTGFEGTGGTAGMPSTALLTAVDLAAIRQVRPLLLRPLPHTSATPWGSLRRLGSACSQCAHTEWGA